MAASLLVPLHSDSLSAVKMLPLGLSFGNEFLCSVSFSAASYSAVPSASVDDVSLLSTLLLGRR